MTLDELTQKEAVKLLKEIDEAVSSYVKYGDGDAWDVINEVYDSLKEIKKQKPKTVAEPNTN